jgi:hypothetical protein
MNDDIIIEILPTKERISKSHGLTGTKKGLGFLSDIDFLYNRGSLGKIGERDSLERLEAARRYEDLYTVLNGEIRPSMTDWNKFMTGTNIPSFDKTASSESMAKKMAYVIYLNNKMLIEGTYGRRGLEVISNIILLGKEFQEVDKKFFYLKGMSSKIFKTSLDDLVKMMGLLKENKSISR